MVTADHGFNTPGSERVIIPCITGETVNLIERLFILVFELVGGN